MLRSRIVFSLFCLAALAGTHVVLAQTTATLYGTVSDSSGAPMANAKVTAANIETNVARKGASATDGSYSLTFLPLGTYRRAAALRHGNPKQHRDDEIHSELRLSRTPDYRHQALLAQLLGEGLVHVQ